MTCTTSMAGPTQSPPTSKCCFYDLFLFLSFIICWVDTQYLLVHLTLTVEHTVNPLKEGRLNTLFGISG